MKPSGLPCSGTDVRWIVVSPDAQIPSVYHLVNRPLPLPSISTRIQVPSGVAAFHEATSSSNAKGVLNGAEVHVPLWKAIPLAPNGSSYVPGTSVPPRLSTPPDATTPLQSPHASVKRWKLTAGSLPLLAAAAGIATSSDRTTASTPTLLTSTECASVDGARHITSSPAARACLTAEAQTEAG